MSIVATQVGQTEDKQEQRDILHSSFFYGLVVIAI